MTTNSRAEAFAPASMGNVGVGFDVLGLAFQEPGDTVRVELRDEPGAVVKAIHGDGGVLPRAADKNTASVAVNAYLKQIGARQGVEITLHKGLPLSSGLGSSAASAVAAVVAANALFEDALPREELLSSCVEGEALVSGYHADNVAPSLLGGIVLITGNTPHDIHKLPVPPDTHMALVTPGVAVNTADARAVLPRSVPLSAMVAQTAAVARLIDALHRGDVPAMAEAMERDGVIEPARAHLMPCLLDVRKAAKRAGALGLVISGAGPTLCAICDSAGTAEAVMGAMSRVYQEADIPSVVRYTRINQHGARVLSVG